jgi:hypothetical protein
VSEADDVVAAPVLEFVLESVLECVDDGEALHAATSPVARTAAATREADSRVRLALDRTAETLTAA